MLISSVLQNTAIEASLFTLAEICFVSIELRSTYTARECHRSTYTIEMTVKECHYSLQPRRIPLSLDHLIATELSGPFSASVSSGH